MIDFQQYRIGDLSADMFRMYIDFVTDNPIFL
jgi:hypothetical protein